MSEKETAGTSGGAQDQKSPAPAPTPDQQEAPATLGQKVLITALYLYVLSLVWLVLSHHWYGVLPKWLDP